MNEWPINKYLVSCAKLSAFKSILTPFVLALLSSFFCGLLLLVHSHSQPSFHITHESTLARLINPHSIDGINYLFPVPLSFKLLFSVYVFFFHKFIRVFGSDSPQVMNEMNDYKIITADSRLLNTLAYTRTHTVKPPPISAATVPVHVCCVNKWRLDIFQPSPPW